MSYLLDIVVFKEVVNADELDEVVVVVVVVVLVKGQVESILFKKIYHFS
jgi:hypothetical protein